MKAPLLFCLFTITVSALTCLQSKRKSLQPDTPPNYRLVLQFDLPASADRQIMLDSAKNVLLRRLEDGIFYSNMSVDPAQQTITLDLIGNNLKEMPSNNLLSQMATTLANKGQLEFYDTYRLSDEVVLQDFLNFFKEDASLMNWVAINSNDGAVFGYVLAEHLQVVDSILNKKIAAAQMPAGLRLAWSSKPEEYGEKSRYEFYFLKNGPVLTGAGIAQSDVVPTEYNPKEAAVNITFDPESARIWANMTTAAAQNHNREIAIVLNGKVLTAPRVINPITEGQSQITGDFSIAEAKSLTQALRSGQLPCSAKILSAQLLR